MKIAYYIGGFRPFHNGHVSIVMRALEDFDKVVIVVGSFSNSISIRCPFTGYQRASIIDNWITNNDLKNRVSISHNEDYLTDDEWLDSLQTFAYQDYAFIVCDRENPEYIDLIKSRYNVKTYECLSDISATKIRNALFDDEYPQFAFIRDNVPSETISFLYDDYVKTLQSAYSYDEYQTVLKIKKEAASLKYPPIYVCADALLLAETAKKTYILLIKRNGKIGNGQFAMPGGYVNQNETTYQAALRELQEETGIQFSIDIPKNNNPILRNVSSYIADYPSRSVRGRVISHVYMFNIYANNNGVEKMILDTSIDDDYIISAGDDAGEVFWLDVNEINKHRSLFFEDHFLIIWKMLNDYYCSKPSPEF